MFPIELEYKQGIGERGRGDLYRPEGNPAVLTIHGGGWSAQDKSSFRGVAEFLAGNGCAVLNINYRLSTIAPWPACAEDCMDAAKYLLRNYPKIFIAGGSAGGHLALMTGLRLPPEQVSGIIALSAIGDPLPDRRLHPQRYINLFQGVPDSEQLNSISPMNYLSPGSPPILYTHAIHDTVVPLESAANFVEAAANIETYFYDLDRKNEGHAVWVPDSNPHRLYPDIEEKILNFIKKYK